MPYNTFIWGKLQKLLPPNEMNTKSKIEQNPAEDWKKLKLEILDKIKELDLKSNRRNTEDVWWLEMSTLKRLIQQSL